MSAKRDKLLESAHKFIAKGQLDRAIRDYEQIVAIDQSDIKQRQKLAELLVRVNRKAEAVANYEIIAKHYSQGMFYLKAIAVYKQIQKLEPDNINTRLALASLYAKQGMSGNALSEFNFAADYFQKGGLSAEALKVIEHMVEADPDNLNSHHRLAEAYYDAGQIDSSYQEFIKLALLHLKECDEAALAKISERVSRLFHNQGDFDIEVLTLLIREGGAAAAIPHLKELLASDKTNLKAWELLAESYLGTGENGERKRTLLGIIENFPDRVAAVESLVQTAIDEGDIAASLDLLKSYEPQFLRCAALSSLERLYGYLREKAPHDQAVLNGLQSLYETCGEREKLASLAAAGEPINSTETDGPQVPETPPGEIDPDLVKEPSPENLAQPSGDMSWEEEIDLSLLDEEGALNSPEEKGATGNDQTPAPSGLPDATAVAPDLQEVSRCEGITIESEAFSEVSLEIDESDLASDDWLKGLPDDGSGDNNGLLQPGGDLEAPVELPGPDEKDITADAEMSIQEKKVVPSGTTGELKEEPAEITPSVRKRRRYDLDGQFSEFKKGLDQQLDEGDTETHYNLGIAYKEMGLYDDAVSEFRIAAIDPQRRIDCMTLQGICLRDKGDYAGAEEIFRNTLVMDGLSGEERLSINYELAFLCETVGRKEEGVRFYREVLAINPGFRDAAKKIAYLQGNEEGEETDLLELDVEEFDP
ncbi:MAG TPA: hypothetical protein VMC44_03025 [Geobacteraceae bacterium]|nr:hypothetical protein [Geobacteraceae bacterium]